MRSRFQAIMIGSKILQGFRLNETWVDCRFYEFYSSDHSSRKHDTDKLKSKGNYYEMKPGCLDRVGRVQGLQRQSCAYVMFTHLVHRDMCTQPALYMSKSVSWFKTCDSIKSTAFHQLKALTPMYVTLKVPDVFCRSICLQYFLRVL